MEDTQDLARQVLCHIQEHDVGAWRRVSGFHSTRLAAGGPYEPTAQPQARAEDLREEGNVEDWVTYLSRWNASF